MDRLKFITITDFSVNWSNREVVGCGMKGVRVLSILLGTWESSFYSHSPLRVLQLWSLSVRARFESSDAHERLAYGCAKCNIVHYLQQPEVLRWSLSILPDRAGRNLSHCSWEPFFLWHQSTWIQQALNFSNWELNLYNPGLGQLRTITSCCKCELSLVSSRDT